MLKDISKEAVRNRQQLNIICKKSLISLLWKSPPKTNSHGPPTVTIFPQRKKRISLCEKGQAQ
jgi:hypothetical protein